MKYLLFCRKSVVSAPLLFATVAFCVLIQSSQAHVELDAPNGGEMLAGGSTFMIAWRPAVAMHDTLNFDVWYSTTASNGPWTVIALDVSPGDLSVGSLHSYAWAVPNITDSSAWVRVRQDNNVDQDYEDVSGGAFSILAALPGDYNNDGTVNAADYVVWRKTGGTQAQLSTWRANFGETTGVGASQGSLSAIAAPEPNVAAALPVGLAIWWGIASWRLPRALLR